MDQQIETPTAARAERHARHGGVVWPLILIGAGIIFLLNNTGTLSWNVWWTLARLWPVILIAIGLDILIGRRSILGSLVVAVLVLGFLGAAVVYWTPAINAAGRNLSTTTINQGLDGASKAAVDISVGTANLTIKEGAEAAGLVQGSVMLSANERLGSPMFTHSGDTANFRLQSSSTNVWPGSFSDPGTNGKRWDLQFNPDVPMSFHLDAGVGNANIDLSRLKITSLSANAGVGNLDVTLPRSGQLTASLDAGVGKVHVIIPAGMASRIQVDRGLGGVDVQGNLQARGDNQYISPGYDTATDRVDMKINGGVGHITIEQQSGS